MAKILILYVDAGYGHRKVAEAVYHELISRYEPGVQVEMFDALKKTNFLFQRSYPKLYYEMVVRVPWLWGFFFALTNSALVYMMISPFRTLWNWMQSFQLRKYIKRGRYDCIIFTHFFPAEVCATEKRTGNIASRLITIVTDIIPHRVWNNNGTDLYWVMARESSERLVRFGVPKDKVEPRGIPVNEQFLTPVNRSETFKAIELTPQRFTILFTSGGFGIGPIEETLRSFEEMKERIQAVVVCGYNKHLLERLNKMNFSFPIRVFGFVSNMHELMSISDLMIAKPGGATTCESLTKGLPMIITSAIPGQETENAKWLIEHQAAFKIEETSDIKRIVKEILENPDILIKMKRSISQIARPKATGDLAEFVRRSL